jgi:bifunctional DNA-binding transcriptional regulator/antitoxin component of YhaV-PrlF toxin-antitoxin module
MISTVTERGQTAIPAAIRRLYHIESHTRIEWIDDGQSINIVPVPEKPIAALRGKFRGKNLSKALALHRAEERKRG